MGFVIKKDKTVKHRKSKRKEKNLVALAQFLKKIKQNGSNQT